LTLKQITFTQKIESTYSSQISSFLACLLGSVLLSLFSQIAIPLPFTPVPVTLQTAIVLVLSIMLGRKAVFAVIGYLAQGFCGLPVFAKGLSGFAVLLGPTGGYLMGFLIASYVIGLWAEKSTRRSYLNAFYMMAAGNLIIYILGAGRLSAFIGFEKALLLGVVPFIVGDLLKIFLSLKTLKAFRWISESI
jgi:biotin transport system substrate-specific component